MPEVTCAGGFGNHISTKIFPRARRPYVCCIDPDKPSLFSGLDYASFGIAEIVACLVGVRGRDINRKGSMGCSPLAWAAVNGHEGVVKILLGRDDIDINKLDDSGRTALWRAATNGHEGVVRILLEKDNANQPDDYGRTLLWWAAGVGHEGVVKVLLERDDVDPNKPDG